MNLTDADVDRIARMTEGKLDDIPFAVLLCALARAESTVVIEITRQALVKKIAVERGVPVKCYSNLAHETLSRFMLSNDLLDETMANECFAESCAKGVRFGDILISNGLITAEELLKLLQMNLAKKLLDCFSWHRGNFRLSNGSAGVDSSLKVNVPQLIVFGVTRFATQQQVDESTSPMIGEVLAVHPKPFFPLDEIRLSAQQRSVVEALGKQAMRIDELASATELPPEDISRTLYAFTLIGAVVPADNLPAEEEKPAAPPRRPVTTPEPPPEPAPPPPAPTKPPTTGQRREELMEMVLNHRRKDPFDLLGIDPDGFGLEAHDRFLRFAERFAPWTYPDDLNADARRVFLAGARAYGELTDPERRQVLIDRRREPGRRRRGTDAFRIDSDVIDPEVQFRKGRALMTQGDYRGALEQFSYASDLDPQNGNYRAELAYCRYLYNPQDGGSAALAELKTALRIDPDSGLVHYYAGLILSSMDLIEEAKRALRRAIKPMAPDRRPVEALKKL